MAHDSSSLNITQWTAIRTVVHRLSAAQRGGAEPDLELLVKGLEPEIRTAALVECVKADLEYRWKNRQEAVAESYFKRWPALRADERFAVDIIEAECVARSRFASPLTSDQLRRRFPVLSEQVDLRAIEQELKEERLFEPQSDLFVSEGEWSTRRRRENEPPPTPTPLPFAEGHPFGRYDILSQLGEGGEGNVYLAHDRFMNRDVALKFPRFADTKVLQRFVRERRSAAGLEHPHICRIYDAGHIDNVHYIAMALIKGRTIQQMMNDGCKFDPREAAVIVGKVAGALEVVHGAGIIHRDIKSGNIMLDANGEPVLMDFGLARPVDAHERLTTTGSFAGTLAFMSAEQAGGKTCDERSDVYSLGVVLYHMLTGDVPFGDVPSVYFRKIGRSPAPSPQKLRPELESTLDGICRKAMATRPEDRFETAADFADALQRFTAGSPQRLRLPGKRRRWWYAAALAVLAVALAGWQFSDYLGRGGAGNTFLPGADQQSGRPGTSSSLARRPLSPWLRECKVTFQADTGATIDPVAAEEMLRGAVGNVFPAWSHLMWNPSLQADIVLERDEEWLRFEVPLMMGVTDNKRDARLAPRDCSLKLRGAISCDGCFQLGTLGDVVEEHLLVFAVPGGFSNYHYFGGRPLRAGQYGEPRSQVISVGERGNLLASWFYTIYRSCWLSKVASDGPEHEGQLYDCPVRVRNFLAEPITVVYAAIYHVQPYDHYDEARRPFDQAAMERWSPIAGDPDEPAEMGLRVDMNCTPDAPSVLFASASSDLQNVVYFKFQGLKVDASAYQLDEDAMATLQLDQQRGVCIGRNSGEACCSATAILFRQAPTRIELGANSVYSSVYPNFRYVTLGTADIVNSQWAPRGSARRDIKPQVWVIPAASDAVGP